MAKTVRLSSDTPSVPAEISIYDPARNTTTPLSRPTVYLGCESDNDISIPSHHVSKSHARITRDPEGCWILEDLGSTNGTFLNRRPVIKAYISAGDAIALANYPLLVVTHLKENPSDLHSLARKLGILLTSEATQKVYRQAVIFAQAKENICVFGQTGTGKEVLARFIHHARFGEGVATKPFLAINIAALPDSLIEFELFGAKKGSFTGAIQDTTGLFESAQDGTLFIDEIGDLASHLQPKLLRALENQEIKRIGENKVRTIACRCIFATHHDLRAKVNHGQFREDLFHRICVLPLTLPSLTGQHSDIDALTKHFLGPNVTLNTDAEQLLRQHTYTGNIRELKNIITRATILAKAAGRQTVIREDILFF